MGAGTVLNYNEVLIIVQQNNLACRTLFRNHLVCKLFLTNVSIKAVEKITFIDRHALNCF